jgi:hypothetical protein
VAQHFLLSAKARTLSLATVLRMSDEEAHAAFCEIRWSENHGKPFYPHCGSTEIYAYKTRRIFRCKACHKQFSVTSGTLFHSRKLPINQSNGENWRAVAHLALNNPKSIVWRGYWQRGIAA